jgi:hypothetical protein
MICRGKWIVVDTEEYLIFMEGNHPLTPEMQAKWYLSPVCTAFLVLLLLSLFHTTDPDRLIS